MLNIISGIASIDKINVMRYSYMIMIETIKKLKPVGEFVRKRREALGLSQRALGLLFSPSVTTQFISNVERGVTPLPPIHIPILAKALEIPDVELKLLLEKEYALKLSGRLGMSGEVPGNETPVMPGLVIAKHDFEFMQSVYDAYRLADPRTRQAFATICESILKLPKVVCSS